MINDNDLEIIMRVAKQLAYKYTFGYYDYDDIVQEAVIIGLERYEYWDKERPLAAFMYVAIGNRLQNLKRNKYFRRGVKCAAHSTYDEHCEACVEKVKKNDTKKNLVDTLDIGNISDEAEPRTHDESEAEEAAVLNEFEATLLEKLSYAERLDYLRLKDGYKIPYARKLSLEAVILGILGNE